MLPYTEKKNVEYFRGQTTRERAAGFCHCRAHKGRLSVKNIRQHGCLGKQCPFLQKYDEHPYWAEREKIKELKKAKKLAAA